MIKNIKHLFTLLVLVLIAISFLAIVNTGYATDKTISPKTDGGIRAAIGSAQDGDTIYLKNGNYYGKDNTNIIITKNITIKGTGSKVVIDGKGKYQIFKIQATEVSLRKIKFTNGRSYKVNSAGAIQGSASVSHCTFTNNRGIAAGAISGQANVSHCTFTNNKNRAIFNANYVNDCTFTNNNGKLGGAIYEVNTVTNCKFTNNRASNGGKGGAICNANYVNSCTFTNNRAGSGGAIYDVNTLTNCKFIKNIGKRGGAICCNSYSVNNVSECTFTNNKASLYGGAIMTYSSKCLKVLNSTFKKNTAKKGNAIFNLNAQNKESIVLKNVKISPKHGAMYTKGGSYASSINKKYAKYL